MKCSIRTSTMKNQQMINKWHKFFFSTQLWTWQGSPPSLNWNYHILFTPSISATIMLSFLQTNSNGSLATPSKPFLWQFFEIGFYWFEVFYWTRKSFLSFLFFNAWATSFNNIFLLSCYTAFMQLVAVMFVFHFLKSLGEQCCWRWSISSPGWSCMSEPISS